MINVPIIGSMPAPKSPLPPFAGTPAPAPLLAGLIQLSTGVKGGLNQLGAAMAPTPLAPNGNPAGLFNIVVQASPIATACVQGTGTGTALLNTDLVVLGIDIGSPLVQTFPGFLAHCPAGSSPAPGSGSTTPGLPGSTIVAVDTNLGDLVGACVRVTTSVVPVQATILVLTQDIIAKFTDAGVPLRSLIIPCPSSSTTPPSGGGGGGSGGGGGGSGGGGTGTGGTGSDAGSGFPDAGSLPFTGAEIGLLMALSLVLLAAGTLMVRKARANQSVVRI